ncbi:MAG: SDR family NAD(P)-dependent oxidoreductase [Burkholderiales bacterium]|nr:SDR family NAD(P)-dependent oxidoreductase [Burkholderiales bacterium]
MPSTDQSSLILPDPYLPSQDLLKDRVIIVTGAGQGMGRMAATVYAEHGATIILTGRNVAKLEATYDTLVAAGGPEPAMLPFDLAKADDTAFHGFAQTVHATFGRLDGILHCAAHFVPLAPVATQTLDQWLELLRVNLAAPFALTRACLPMLKRATDASVVFVGESHGVRPKAYWGGFAVAKAGLGALTTIWAQELAQSAVRINCLVPGPVDSPQRRQSHPGEMPGSLPTLASLAPTCLYLIGPDSRQVTGHLLELTHRDAT